MLLLIFEHCLCYLLSCESQHTPGAESKIVSLKAYRRHHKIKIKMQNHCEKEPFIVKSLVRFFAQPWLNPSSTKKR